MTFTLNHRRATVVIPPPHKLTFKGQSFQKLEWKQSNRRTDRRTILIAMPSRLRRSINTWWPLQAGKVSAISRMREIIGRKLSPLEGIRFVQCLIMKLCSKSLRMARDNDGSQFYLPPTRLSTNEMSHPAFTASRRASPHFGRYSLPVPQRVGGWVGLGGWLHTEVV